MSRTASSNGLPQKTGQQQPPAIDTLVEQHLGLVMHLAKRYAGRYQGHHILDLDDLYQEGVLGLLHAAEKYDAHKGFQFSTYAAYWIRRAMGRAIMQASRTIRLPSPMWDASMHLVRARATLWQQQQREPSPDELAAAMQCEKEHVLLLLHLQHEPVSLEQPVYSEDEEMTLGQTLEASDDSEQQEQHQEIAELLTHLNPQERRVIETRYQLGQASVDSVEDIPLPYTIVGRQLGMTASLVKTIETRALLKMRFWAERRLPMRSGQERLATRLLITQLSVRIALQFRNAEHEKEE